MADDIEVPEGVGRVIAADEIDGKLHQRVKLSLGVDGAASDAVGGPGEVTTGTQRVTLANDDPAASALALGASGLRKAEDAPHTSGDVGMAVLAVRRDSKTPGASADGRYAVLAVNGAGDLRVDGGQAYVTPPITPEITDGAYDPDDILGGLMEVEAVGRVTGGSGLLTAITAIIQDDGAAEWAPGDIEVLVFTQRPGGEYADNEPLADALTFADARLALDAIVLDEKSALGDTTLLRARGLFQPYVCMGGTSLYALAINRGAKTPAAVDGISFKFHVTMD